MRGEDTIYVKANLAVNWCPLGDCVVGKEKLADYLGVSADEARNITHSFLGCLIHHCVCSLT